MAEPLPLPPGAVGMEDAVRSQAGMSQQPPKMNLGQMYEDYVASPLTQVVSRLVPQSPFQMPGSFDPSAPSTGVAKMLVPQNLTEAGIAAATMGAGGLAGKAGMAGLKAGATRIGGAMLGGSAGKMFDEGAFSAGAAAKGAAQGLVAGVTGEAIGAGLQYARKAGVERARAKVQALDAGQTAQAIGGNPKLQGVFKDIQGTPEGLRDLALGTVPDPKNPGKVIGKGESLIKAYLDQQDGVIGQRLVQQEEQMGRKYFFPDPFHDGKSLPFDEARKALSKLGDMTRMKPQQSIQVEGKTLYGGDVKQLYAGTLRAWQQQFALIDSQAPQLPSALTAFNEARGANEAATATLKLLQEGFRQKTAGRTLFNSDRLQDILANKQKDYTNKLGPEGFWSLANALRIPAERIGQRDVLQPTGAMAALAGVVPLPGAAYARVNVGTPNLVGNPFQVPNAARTGLDIGASQALGRGLDLGGSAMQGAQGMAQNLFTMPIQSR